VPPQLSLAVVGAKYANKRGPTRIFELEICQPGEAVELRPEPANPADPRAIAVYSCRGIQIGYVTAERAPRVGQLVRQGAIDAIFQERTDYGAVIRVAFGRDVAFLAEAGPTAQLAPDFWPDEDWPDE
jgi:hypothetical protein